jgi:two-component system cell cycle sensor histidine kinase/response regulator CckA
MAEAGKQPANLDRQHAFRSLYLHMLEAVALHELVCDGAGHPVNYRILDANPQFRRYFGSEGQPIAGRLATELFGVADPPYLDELAAVALGGQPLRFEAHFVAADRYYDVSVVPLGVGQFATLFLDITELRTREQQMLQSQKLESLGVLAGGIAHDFNNLLTGILGNADLARTEMSPLAPGRANLEAIESAARRAADLCRQLLAYSGRGRFLVEPLSLRDLVEKMGHLLKMSAGRAVVELHLAASVPAIEGDAAQLRQVVMSLVVNACEAIGERNGKVSITVGAAPCDAEYLKGCVATDPLPEGEYVYLEVQDNGEGIPPAAMSRIFDPFFSTRFAGRGLGLPAVLGIVRGHRGGLRVGSEAGEGTTFRLLFPASKQTPSKPAAARGPTGSGRASGTILLADDEETIRNLGRRMLRAAGYEVITAADGREAIEKFTVYRDTVDLVILDLTMPHFDGEGCFCELRKLKAGVRVLLSSGYSEQETVTRFEGQGLAGFVQKPYTTGELLAKIREALQK